MIIEKFWENNAVQNNNYLKLSESLKLIVKLYFITNILHYIIR